MSKSYVPGDDTDAIIARQAAKGNFASADAAVRAGVRMLEEYEEEIARLRAKIEAAEAAYQRGDFVKSDGADKMTADIVARGEARSLRKT